MAGGAIFRRSRIIAYAVAALVSLPTLAARTAPLGVWCDIAQPSWMGLLMVTLPQVAAAMLGVVSLAAAAAASCQRRAEYDEMRASTLATGESFLTGVARGRIDKDARLAKPTTLHGAASSSTVRLPGEPASTSVPETRLGSSGAPLGEISVGPRAAASPWGTLPQSGRAGTPRSLTPLDHTDRTATHRGDDSTARSEDSGGEPLSRHFQADVADAAGSPSPPAPPIGGAGAVEVLQQGQTSPRRAVGEQGRAGAAAPSLPPAAVAILPSLPTAARPQPLFPAAGRPFSRGGTQPQSACCHSGDCHTTSVPAGVPLDRAPSAGASGAEHSGGSEVRAQDRVECDSHPAGEPRAVPTGRCHGSQAGKQSAIEGAPKERSRASSVAAASEAGSGAQVTAPGSPPGKVGPSSFQSSGAGLLALDSTGPVSQSPTERSPAAVRAHHRLPARPGLASGPFATEPGTDGLQSSLASPFPALQAAGFSDSASASRPHSSSEVPPDAGPTDEAKLGAQEPLDSLAGRPGNSGSRHRSAATTASTGHFVALRRGDAQGADEPGADPAPPVQASGAMVTTPTAAGHKTTDVPRFNAEGVPEQSQAPPLPPRDVPARVSAPQLGDMSDATLGSPDLSGDGEHGSQVRGGRCESRLSAPPSSMPRQRDGLASTAQHASHCTAGSSTVRLGSSRQPSAGRWQLKATSSASEFDGDSAVDEDAPPPRLFGPRCECRVEPTFARSGEAWMMLAACIGALVPTLAFPFAPSESGVEVLPGSPMAFAILDTSSAAWAQGAAEVAALSMLAPLAVILGTVLDCRAWLASGFVSERSCCSQLVAREGCCSVICPETSARALHRLMAAEGVRRRQRDSRVKVSASERASPPCAGPASQESKRISRPLESRQTTGASAGSASVRDLALAGDPLLEGTPRVATDRGDDDSVPGLPVAILADASEVGPACSNAAAGPRCESPAETGVALSRAPGVRAQRASSSAAPTGSNRLRSRSPTQRAPRHERGCSVESGHVHAETHWGHISPSTASDSGFSPVNGVHQFAASGIVSLGTALQHATGAGRPQRVRARSPGAAHRSTWVRPGDTSRLQRAGSGAASSDGSLGRAGLGRSQAEDTAAGQTSRSSSHANTSWRGIQKRTSSSSSKVGLQQSWGGGGASGRKQRRPGSGRNGGPSGSAATNALQAPAAQVLSGRVRARSREGGGGGRQQRRSGGTAARRHRPSVRGVPLRLPPGSIQRPRTDNVAGCPSPLWCL